MKTAIVIGANGYLGRHMVLALGNSGFTVIASGFEEKSVDNVKNYIQIDISKPDDVAKLNFDVDLIFLFAGLTGTNIGFDEYAKFVSVNELGLLNVLTHYNNQSSKARIIFPSTRLVYEGSSAPLKEDAPKECLTPYAMNKLACEGYLKMFNNYYGTNYTIFRICVPYGNLFDDAYSYGTIGFFLSKATSGSNITLFGDGKQKRTFSHVSDITQSVLLAISKPETNHGIYNIGSDDNLSLIEAASMVADKYGVSVQSVEWPTKAEKIESGDTVFDDSHLLTSTGYEYQYSLGNWITEL